jgi:hypothetical protein
MKTFKEFAEALLAGKTLVNDDGESLSLTERGALEWMDEDNDSMFFEQQDFSIDYEEMTEFRIKEKRLVVSESEIEKLASDLMKTKTKEGLTKKLSSLLKMN